MGRGGDIPQKLVKEFHKITRPGAGLGHGGIVRLPFLGGVAGTNFALFPEYDAGLFETGSYKLYISRGLGNSVPLPRFLNTPELVSITLKCA